jgi:hypothetical protein
MALLQSNSILGISVTGLSSLPLSGFTKATPFTCSVVPNEGFNEASVTQTYYLIWWFGDGTYQLGYNVQHTYDWPGIYEIKLGAFNFNNSIISVSGSSGTDALSSLLLRIGNTDFNLIGPGIQQRTFSTLVTAGNYLTDNLAWNYSAWPDLSSGQPSTYGAIWHGYQSCKSGTASGAIPLAFNFAVNNPVLSSIVFNFYSEKSFSQPATEVLPSQYSRLRPQWRFTTVPKVDTDDGNVFTSYTPLTGTEVRILSSGVPSPSGVLIGYSGTIYFYYIDDLPSQYTTVLTTYDSSLGYVYTLSAGLNTPTLWVIYNTENIYNPQKFEYGNLPSYSNAAVILSSQYYIQALTPDHISFTLDGYLPLYSTYWPYVESKFITTVNSPVYTDTRAYLSDKPLLQLPYVGLIDQFNTGNIINISLSANSSPSNSAIVTFNNNPLSLSANSIGTIAVLSNFASGSFVRYNNDVNYAGGWFETTFTPFSIGTVQLSGIAPINTSTLQGGITYIIDPSASPLSGFNPNTLVVPGSIATTLVSGSSTPIQVIDYYNTLYSRKFNEGFDYGPVLKQYALQSTINENTVFFDNYLTTVAGTSAEVDENFGAKIYEKIANFTANVSDPITCNVNEFYSIAKSLQVEYDNYNFNSPPALRQVFDTFSIPQSKLWGSRSLFNRDFSLSAHTNLGRVLTAYNVDTTIISAGQKIVVNSIFNPQYFELIEVPLITSYSVVTAFNLQYLFPTTAYPINTYPLSSYPLSAFFGAGLQTPVKLYYKFYVYDPTPNLTQAEGVINWDDEYTTLSEHVSSNVDWVKDGGKLEQIFSFNIHKGLGLIQ